MHRKLRFQLLAAGVAAWLGLAGTTAWAKPVAPEERIERTERLPARLHGVDVVERLDTQLPLETRFRDETGRQVRLKDYFDGKRPVIVTLNYSNCPMLCSMQLTGLVASLKQLEQTPADEFRIVTVSLDPAEQPARAAETKARYLKQYGRAGAARGWHFVTGDQAAITAVASAIGFRYGYNEARKEYVHPAAIALASPDGRLVRYLYGIEYHPKTLGLSLAEAAEGKVGSTLDRLILYCFHYDEKEGRYAPVARNIMRVGGALTATVLGAVLTSFWLAELRNKKRQAKALS
jgi:protein SCO1/2